MEILQLNNFKYLNVSYMDPYDIDTYCGHKDYNHLYDYVYRDGEIRISICKPKRYYMHKFIDITQEFLSMSQYQIVALVIKGYRLREISKLLNISVGATKEHLLRAIDKIKIVILYSIEGYTTVKHNISTRRIMKKIIEKNLDKKIKLLMNHILN